MTISEHYDFVIIGTGLTETAISCVLAKQEKYKILHLDTSAIYGSEFSTLNYSELKEYFKNNSSEISGGVCKLNNAKLTELNKGFNIDLTPKLMLRDSELKDFLIKNKIDDLVEFTSICESYLYTTKLHAVPTSEAQALKSGAISGFQKIRVAQFFWNIRSYFKNNDKNIKPTMLEEFNNYSLSQDSIDFIGHAIALNLNDSYLNEPPHNTYENI